MENLTGKGEEVTISNLPDGIRQRAKSLLEYF